MNLKQLLPTVLVQCTVLVVVDLGVVFLARMEGAKKVTSVPAVGRPTRPKAWQQLWLDGHREAMVKRLQDHVMAIVDRLVQEGDIDPALDEAYQFVVAAHTLPVEKVRRLLDSLHKRSPEAFEHFQSALRENGCGDLTAKDDDARMFEAEVDALPAFQRLSLELGIPTSVREARECVQRSYLEAASEVHMLASVSRGDEEMFRHLEEVFVNIGLVSTNEVEKLCSEWTGKDGGVEEVLAQAMNARQITLHGLLEAQREGGKAPVRIMALGTAGSGKSFTFTVKAAYDWCGGTMWEKIALLRTIRCRDKGVWHAKTISELFQLRELGLSAAQEVEVEKFISQHPSHFALVCDGLDEGQVDESSFLWRVMNGTSLRGLRVIITSRPCSAVSDLSQSGAINRHAQLFGFSKENVREFVTKYLGRSHGAEMLSQLTKQPSMSSLMHTPLFALLVCEQFKEEGQVPSTRSGIFSSVTLRLVQRCARSKGLKAKFKRVDKAPGLLYKHVLELGKVAFDRLKCKDLSYFELEEEDLPAEAIALGFLEHMQSTSASEEDQYGFRHLTMQEYLAALYVCAEVLKKEGDVVKLVEQLGAESGHLNTFWVFVAGLVEINLREELLCAIAKTDIQTVTRSMQAMQRVPGSRKSVDSPSAPSGESGGGQGEETKAKDLRERVAERLGVYRFLLLLHCFQEGATSGCFQASACVKYVLKAQGVYCRDYLTPSDLGVISRVMQYHSDIVEKADLSKCRLGDDGLQQLLPGLLSCTRLKELDLLLCLLSKQLMVRVGEVFANNKQTLATVNLSGNSDVGDEGLRRLGEGLHQVKHLRSLKLSDLGLTKASGPTLASIISHQPSLVKCHIGLNCIADSGVTAMAPALQKCQHLLKLDLWDIGLTCDSNTMLVLSSVLASLPRLSHLDLGGNRIQDEGFIHLAPGLQQCSQLHFLRLSRCGLTSDGRSMALLTSVLLCLPHLAKFSVDDNRIGDSGLDQLSIGLEECSQLTRLDLWNIGMTSSQSMSSISRLLQRLSRLTFLNLWWNACGGDSSDWKFCAAVKVHPSMEVLWLPKGMSRDSINQLSSLRNDPMCALMSLNSY